MVSHSLLAPKRLVAHVATEGNMSWRIAMLLHSCLTAKGPVTFAAHVRFAYCRIGSTSVALKRGFRVQLLEADEALIRHGE
jgi:hypothetical protein